VEALHSIDHNLVPFGIYSFVDKVLDAYEMSLQVDMHSERGSLFSIVPAAGRYSQSVWHIRVGPGDQSTKTQRIENGLII
jgi:hypothetical protein